VPQFRGDPKGSRKNNLALSLARDPTGDLINSQCSSEVARTRFPASLSDEH